MGIMIMIIAVRESLVHNHKNAVVSVLVTKSQRCMGIIIMIRAVVELLVHNHKNAVVTVLV